jgi:hypothetical protein
VNIPTRSAISSLVSSRLEYDLPHDRLEVLAEARVEVSARGDVMDTGSAAWEEVREALMYSGQPMNPVYLDACRFRMESSYVKIKQAFNDYFADCFEPGGVAPPRHSAHYDSSARLARHENP